MMLVIRNNDLQRTWISSVSQTVLGSVWGSAEKIGDYFRLSRINDELAQENFELREKLAAMGVDMENLELEKSESVVVDNLRYTHAEIIKMGNNSQHNYLIINKGAKHGISVNSGVITPQGVVGMIESVSDNFSYGYAFTNAEFSVSTRVGQEGAVGPLSWNGLSSRGAILKEIPLHITFEKGDTVYTSGHSSFFPADIPIGKVVDRRVVNGSTYDIDIELFQDFRSIRYVTVVSNILKEELDNLEKKKNSEKKKK